MPGLEPMEPMEAWRFWLSMAFATSEVESPREARRSGSSQMRMLYFAPCT